MQAVLNFTSIPNENTRSNVFINAQLITLVNPSESIINCFDQGSRFHIANIQILEPDEETPAPRGELPKVDLDYEAYLPASGRFVVDGTEQILVIPLKIRVATVHRLLKLREEEELKDIRVEFRPLFKVQRYSTQQNLGEPEYCDVAQATQRLANHRAHDSEFSLDITLAYVDILVRKVGENTVLADDTGEERANQNGVIDAPHATATQPVVLKDA